MYLDDLDDNLGQGRDAQDYLGTLDLVEVLQLLEPVLPLGGHEEYALHF